MALLKYWIEGTSKLWIKVPTIPADAKIFLKVKKTGSCSPSGDDTFLFFDDFSSWNGDKWKYWRSIQGGDPYEETTPPTVTDGYVWLQPGGYRGTASIQSEPFENSWKQVKTICTVRANGSSIKAQGGFPELRENDASSYRDCTQIVRTSGGYTNAFHRHRISVLSEYTQGAEYWRSDTTDTAVMTIEATQIKSVFRGETITRSYTPDKIPRRCEIGVGDDYGDTSGGMYVYEIIIMPFVDDVPGITVTDKTSHYEIEIDNTGGNELEGYVIEVDASEFGGLANDESLEISEYLSEFNFNFNSIKTISNISDLPSGSLVSLEGQEYVKSVLRHPDGIYVGDFVVILKGYTNGLSGLTAGKFYYMDENGDLTNNPVNAFNGIKVGYAISDTEMLVDIKNIGNTYPFGIGFGDVVFSTNVEERTFGGMKEGIHYWVDGNTLILSPNIEYKFNSFDLKVGTTLTTTSDGFGTVLYLTVTNTCNISGDVILSNINPPGQYGSEYDIQINGELFSYPSCANGGSGRYWHFHKNSYLGFGGGGGGADQWWDIPSTEGTDGGKPFGTRGQSERLEFTWREGRRSGTLSVTEPTNYSAGGCGGGIYDVRVEEGTLILQGGSGGRTYGDDGSRGTVYLRPDPEYGWEIYSSYAIMTGGGGAGGIAGKSGIHFYVNADTITINGTIDVSGSPGGNGGNGGRTRTNGPTFRPSVYFEEGGYGGGGGGGGNSANIYLKYHTTEVTTGATFLVNGGLGGEGGKQPYDGPYPGNTNDEPNEWINPSENGQPGSNGHVYIEQIL